MCYCNDIDDYDDEESDFECPECGEELNEDDECANEQCSNFECNPLIGGHDDDAKWERRQMGIDA
jgi:hypothetical protein